MAATPVPPPRAPTDGMPPRPRLVVRVGVTGHKRDALPPDADGEIRQRVREVLLTVREAAERAAADRAASYAPRPPLLRIVSALAEGADRLVAEEALALRAAPRTIGADAAEIELHCVLPFAQPVYAEEFTSDDSRREFDRLRRCARAVLELDGRRDGAADGSPTAYQTLGHVLRVYSDVLIAVWDRQPPRGPGGTGDVARAAVAQGLVVVHIDPHDPRTARLLVPSHQTHGEIAERDIAHLAPSVDRLLRPRRAPAGTAAIRSGLDRAPDLRAAYFAEHYPRGRLLGRVLGTIFPLVRRLFGAGGSLAPRLLPRDLVESTRRQWHTDWSRCAGLRSVVTRQVEDGLLRHYAWADGLATYFANVYRGSFILIFVLGAAAVVAALLAYFSRESPAVALAWTFGEFLVISLAAFLNYYGRRSHWHERWLDYRQLAEQLRVLVPLVPLAGGLPALHVPAHESHLDPRDTWVHWCTRAVVRELPLPSAVMDRSYLAACRALLLDWEMRGQIAYHGRNAAAMHVLHERLHGVTTGLFVLTGVLCLVHIAVGVLAHPPHLLAPTLSALGVSALPESAERLLTALTLGTPALGAALHGIDSQGDFENLSQRSGAMAARLVEIRMAQAAEPAEPATLTSVALRAVAEDVALAMTLELVDWRVDVQTKPLPLPA